MWGKMWCLLANCFTLYFYLPHTIVLEKVKILSVLFVHVYGEKKYIFCWFVQGVQIFLGTRKKLRLKFFSRDFTPCLLACYQLIFKQYAGSTLTCCDDPPLGNESSFGLVHYLM